MPRQTSRQTRARYLVLLALFVVSTINFGDRPAMAVAPAVSATLHLDPVTMGYVLAAFAISLRLDHAEAADRVGKPMLPMKWRDGRQRRICWYRRAKYLSDKS
jgi:hypothetical protein